MSKSSKHTGREDLFQCEESARVHLVLTTKAQSHVEKLRDTADIDGW
jgi:hypothetical protein